MRTVADESGRRFLLLKASGDRRLVRDLETGERRYVPVDDLSPIDGEPPLVAAASAIPEDAMADLPALPDDRAAGLLALLAMRGPTAVRDLLSATELCESDLHGLVGELTAAGMLEETRVAGERGYELAPEVDRTLDQLATD